MPTEIEYPMTISNTDMIIGIARFLALRPKYEFASAHTAPTRYGGTVRSCDSTVAMRVSKINVILGKENNMNTH